MSNKTLASALSKLDEGGESRLEAVKVIDSLSSIVALTSSMSGNEKLSKAMLWGSLALSVGTAAKTVYDFVKKAKTPVVYTIKIHESDSIFKVAEDWFMDSLPEDQQLSVYAHSNVKSEHDDFISEIVAPEVPEASKNQVDVYYTFDGEITHQMTVRGHVVQIYASTPDTVSGADTGRGPNNFQKSRTIYITCPNILARDAVLDELESLSQSLHSRPNRLFVSTKWGNFRKVPNNVPRSMDTVFLKDGQMERIMDYITSFRENKEAYQKAGIPYRMGILLHGEPGSGKSTVAGALATKLKMDIYVMNISAIGDDDNLGECFERIPANSIVVMEDIDVAHGVKDRDDDSGVTMSGMLNVLDGFQSPPGVITIMTTNRLDVLDPAIIRPGRVDVTENLSCLDQSQLINLCNYFMKSVPENLPQITPADMISSAEVIGVFRNHLPDFENAADELVQFITDKLLTSLEV